MKIVTTSDVNNNELMQQLHIMALTTSQCGPTLVLDLSLEEAFVTAFLIKGCLSISASFSSLGIVLRSYNIFVLINLEDRIVRTIIGGTRMFAFPDARLVDQVMLLSVTHFMATLTVSGFKVFLYLSAAETNASCLSGLDCLRSQTSVLVTKATAMLLSFEFVTDRIN